MSLRATSSSTTTTTTKPTTTDHHHHHHHHNAVSIVKASELVTPSIAWPTLCLLVLAFTIYTSAIVYLYPSHPYICTVVCGLAIFAMFTPMHDSAHMAISRKHKWINHVAGRVCAMMYLAPFSAFRYVHLEHHKHTNDPEKDPDMWSTSGPFFLLPLRWMSQEMHYYLPYFGEILAGRRSTAEIVEVLVSLIGGYWLIYTGFQHGHGRQLIHCYLVPLRIAVLLLAYSFDFLPHATQTHTLREKNKFQTTNRILGITDVNQWWSDYCLTGVLLYQNFHNVHHLYPTIPFYHYARVWWAHRDEFIAQGQPEVSLRDANRPFL